MNFTLKYLSKKILNIWNFQGTCIYKDEKESHTKPCLLCFGMHTLTPSYSKGVPVLDDFSDDSDGFKEKIFKNQIRNE